MPSDPDDRRKPPSLAEIEDAVSQLREPTALCYIELSKTNRGVAAALSFRPAFVETEFGTVEIALREATLNLRPGDSKIRWSYADEWCALSRELRVEAGITSVSNSELASLTRTDGTTIKTDGRVKFGVALFGGDVGGGAELADKQDARKDSGKTTTWTYPQHHPYLGISNGPKDFTMVFSSGPMDDLSDLNNQLSSRPLINQHTDSDAEIDPKGIKVVLRFTLDGSKRDTRHSFNIRRATGSWESLRDQSNKRIFSEILLSKFLVPTHQPLHLWPSEDDDFE